MIDDSLSILSTSLRKHNGITVAEIDINAKRPVKITAQVSGQVTGQVTGQVGVKITAFC